MDMKYKVSTIAVLEDGTEVHGQFYDTRKIEGKVYVYCVPNDSEAAAVRRLVGIGPNVQWDAYFKKRGECMELAKKHWELLANIES
jgi:hypothetical protein